MKIAISGLSGSGNTSISHQLANVLGIKCINYTLRDLAKEKGLSLDYLRQKAKEDPSYDQYLDKKQLSMTEELDCILSSRLAIFLFVKAQYKFFLYAPLSVRAERIAYRENKSYQLAYQETKQRDKEDRDRYQDYYKINIEQIPRDTVMINVQFNNIKEIVQKIIFLLKWN